MPLTQENKSEQVVLRVTSTTPTTLACNNPQKKRRMTFTTDEEEEDLTFKEFQKAQDDFREPSPSAIMKAITQTAAYYKDSLLRSSLCRQPESREHADNIIVNNVMSAVAVEEKAAVTRERVLISNRPISSEPPDPHDLD